MRLWHDDVRPAPDGWVWAQRVEQLEAALTQATQIAGHLLGMIDRETWRAQGGDDGQGHYEGDYWQEQTAAQIAELKALVALPEEPPRG